MFSCLRILHVVTLLAKLAKVVALIAESRF